MGLLSVILLSPVVSDSRELRSTSDFFVTDSNETGGEIACYGT